jgi:Iron-sulfur cluster assembly accessory protein
MEPIVRLTEAAAFQIKDILKENEEGNAYFRISVHGGGCSGLSYGIGLDDEKRDTDIEVDQFGVKVLVNEQDVPVLKGTTIDYKESLLGGGFTIDNPNAIFTCGCGSSFRTAANAGTPEKC